jgi:pimeloyl-ACP methyl ester carboxylesterase
MPIAIKAWHHVRQQPRTVALAPTDRIDPYQRQKPMRFRWLIRCHPVSVTGNPQAMEAVRARYRARGVRHAPVGPTEVPTLFIWGGQDDTVGRAAAVWTAEFIAAP